MQLQPDMKSGMQMSYLLFQSASHIKQPPVWVTFQEGVENGRGKFNILLARIIIPHLEPWRLTKEQLMLILE
jgi:hypothetical protein